jgi:peptidyl-prolyl cis-trans isomerase SurA
VIIVKRALRSKAFVFASTLAIASVSCTAYAAQLGAPFTAAAKPPPAAPAGQSGMTIAAVVNEDIITLFDVQSRMGMVMVSSGMENTPDLQRRLMPQVVDALIEERLKLQEATRLKIKTTETEIRQQVDQIEQYADRRLPQNVDQHRRGPERPLRADGSRY